ncbi:MAG: D-alanine--D-alanine ligase [Thermodesulfobacteriota bacterium]
MRILLIAGGWSPERDVSLSGARGIETALKSLGHAVTLLDPERGLSRIIPEAREHDFAFLNLHGRPGEDGLIQAMLDAVGCPYQGSGPAGSFLALDKAAAKEIFRHQGLPTPAWEYLPTRPAPGWKPGISLPVFVKPNVGGSSLGMHRVSDPRDLAPAMDGIFSMGEGVLLEECVPGQEITCPVLGDEALPLILIRPLTGTGYFDYRSKYEPKQAEEICPAPVDAALARRIQDITLAAHRGLGLSGYSRADFMVRDGAPFLLEVNTLPGMTPTSLLPQSAAAAGLDFPALLARLMELGMRERGGKRSA